jgi:hypothetical protein
MAPSRDAARRAGGVHAGHPDAPEPKEAESEPSLAQRTQPFHAYTDLQVFPVDPRDCLLHPGRGGPHRSASVRPDLLLFRLSRGELDTVTATAPSLQCF